MRLLVERLTREHRLNADEYRSLLTTEDRPTIEFLRDNAAAITRRVTGRGVFLRGLIEISSYCRNNCLYCGLRRDNNLAVRYRLSDDEILRCCENGYRLGLRTFVLQSGEDSALSDSHLVRLVSEIHKRWQDAAITLSLGERSTESYLSLYEAGASRYLLRHEAADKALYNRLHPAEMSLDNRINCIKSLIDIGYQTGMGMMIGVPGQTIDNLVADLLLMEQMQPQMIGIGPFIPHSLTPFARHQPGDLTLTLKLIAITRLMFPTALIPSTTALATLSPTGRLDGILSGANVTMPNLSPSSVRDKYAIYENKASSGAEAAEGINLLKRELASIGYHINLSRGDYRQLNSIDCL